MDGETQTAARLFTGHDIADMAVAALHNRAFTATPGDCQMFVREVVQSVCDDRIGTPETGLFGGIWQGSAANTMRAFRGTRYVVWELSSGKPQPPLQDGDGLYKGRLTSGAFGHTGIAANGRHIGLPPSVVAICENSSYHINPDHMGDVQGAKGWRSLEAFGPFEMVVRWTN